MSQPQHRGGDRHAGPALERFREAWTRQLDLGVADDLLPTHLLRACAEALSADGAGLSVLSATIRVPLGASDHEAIAAERLQFTVGEGPCLAALDSETPIGAGPSMMRQRWPVFVGELIQRTSYRSIVSVPLRFAGGYSGALDVYFTAAGDPTRSTVTDTEAIAGQLAAILATGGSSANTTADRNRDGHDDRDGRRDMTWLQAASVGDRMRVWIAVGMLIGRTGVSSPDALTLLRAHAFAVNDTVDDLAEAMIAGEVAIEDVA